MKSRPSSSASTASSTTLRITCACGSIAPEASLVTSPKVSSPNSSGAVIDEISAGGSTGFKGSQPRDKLAYGNARFRLYLLSRDAHDHLAKRPARLHRP